MSDKKNKILKINGIIFAIMALGPLLRLLLGLDVIIGNFKAPRYLSGIAVVIFGILSFLSFRTSSQ